MSQLASFGSAILLLICAAMVPGESLAQGSRSLFLDFEFFPGPDGMLGTADDVPAPDCELLCFTLSDEYEPLGLVFTSGFLFQGGLFPGTEPSDHFLSSVPADVTLTTPVFEVSIESFSGHDAALYGFDEMGQIIATDTLEIPAEGDFFFGTLRITSDQPIWRFLVEAAECCGRILNLDNLSLSFDDPAIFADGFESGDLSAW